MREKFVHIAMDDKLFIYAFLFFLITSGSFVASAKDFLIVDDYFDDGSVLPNAKFKKLYRSGDDGQIKVKHENEFFTLNFEDLKTLEFGVEPGTSQVKICDFRVGIQMKI